MARDFNYALYHAQRMALNVLIKGSRNKDGEQVIKPAKPSNITMPATLVQELALSVNIATYTFKFGTERPASSATLGNVNMGDNDVFACYGIQMLFGDGDNAVNRRYQATGNSASDDMIYNGELFMKQESDEPVHTMSTLVFREAGDFYPMAGFEFINPIRIVTGQMSKFNIIVSLGDVSGLTLTTANPYVSMRLHGAIVRGG